MTVDSGQLPISLNSLLKLKQGKEADDLAQELRNDDASSIVDYIDDKSQVSQTDIRSSFNHRCLRGQLGMQFRR